MQQPDEAPHVRRCNDCRKWYDKSLAECPSCEAPRPAFNKSLRTAELNNHLFGMQAQAQAERRKEQQIMAAKASGRGNPFD